MARQSSSPSRRNGWTHDWLNDAVSFHLSAIADVAVDRLAYGNFRATMPPVEPLR